MSSGKSNSSSINNAKWIFVCVTVIVAGYLNSIYVDQFPLLYRFICLLLVGIIAILLALSTVQGKAFIQFSREARQEVRKVIWPKKNETLVTSGFVAVVVVIFSIVLWLVDSLLKFIISLILG